MGDLQQQGTREAERRHCLRSQPRHWLTSASVDITGKRCDAKVSRTVWREADGKGLHQGLCRKIAFSRHNPKIVYWKIKDLRVPTFLFSIICDRARGST